MLKILGKAASINVRKVLWTCAELDLAYEREDWGIGFRSTGDPAFLALNPHAMVPVLIDANNDVNTVLWESNTICRYLATVHGDGSLASLLPRDPVARAHVEGWMDWQATELNNAWRYAFSALVRNSPSHDDPTEIAASVAAWNRQMGVLAQRLEQTGAYVAGPTFSLADIVLGLSSVRWTMTPIDHAAYPAIDAYLERLSARPGYRAFGANGLP